MRAFGSKHLVLALVATVVSPLVSGNSAGGANSPAELDAADLLGANGGDGSAGVVLNGAAQDDEVGVRVSSAGDVNGDGIGDIALGAGPIPGEGKDPITHSRSYVVFGSDEPFDAEFELAGLLATNGGDGSAGFVLNAIDPEDGARFVAGAGDLNGDGLDDLIVGAPFADPSGQQDGGQIYVIFGSAQPFPSEIALASLLTANGGDGSVGLVVNGIAADDRAGRDVDAVGDLNADGFDDVIIAAPGAAQIYVLFGTDSGFPAEIDLADLLAGDGSSGFVINSGSGSEFDVAGAGDINDDGIDDIAIAASDQVFLIYGSEEGFAAEADIADLAGTVFVGAPTSFKRISRGGDVNTDGIDDLAIGEPGQAFVVFGSDQLPAEFDLSSLASGDGSMGFVINEAIAGDDAGAGVAGGRDVNGDSLGDLLIGAPGIALAAQPEEAFVVFGSNAGFSPQFPLADLFAPVGDGGEGFVVNGFGQDLFAFDVALLQDVNGDLVSDVLIGEPLAFPNGFDSGRAFVVFGRFDVELACDALIAKIDAARIRRGVQNSLTQKIENACNNIDQGEILEAEEKFVSFIEEVDAQTGRAITAETAGELITHAEVFLANL